MGIDITSSKLFCLVFLGGPQGSILCSVFLIYIKSNHIVSTTVKKLAAECILLFTAMIKL